MTSISSSTRLAAAGAAQKLSGKTNLLFSFGFLGLSHFSLWFDDLWLVTWAGHGSRVVKSQDLCFRRWLLKESDEIHVWDPHSHVPIQLFDCDFINEQDDTDWLFMVQRFPC